MNNLKKKLLENPSFRDFYYNKSLAFQISEMIIEARRMNGVSQEELAKLMRTKQPSIARAENGAFLPSLNFLEKIADSLETKLIPPKFECLEKQNQTVNILNSKWVTNKINALTLINQQEYHEKELSYKNFSC